MTEQELASGGDTDRGPPVPYPFRSAAEMLEMCRASGLSIAEMKRANEMSRGTAEALDRGLARIWEVMKGTMDRGLATDGILPGGLNVKRRAPAILRALEAERGRNLTAPHVINDWISTYAMAVNEENAAGGQVVTAPTNGAAGVIPATIRYWLDHVPGASQARVPEFLLTAAAVGGLIKFNASISGAECGCQAEVGSAAAMAAAGLAAVLGGSPEQVENAAEIALEHHLGMTCDPVRGLVQVPCIERNGLGAIKAVSAASLALRGDGIPPCSTGRGHRDDAPDRGRHEREIQGNGARRAGGQRAELLRLRGPGRRPGGGVVNPLICLDSERNVPSVSRRYCVGIASVRVGWAVGGEARDMADQLSTHRSLTYLGREKINPRG